MSPISQADTVLQVITEDWRPYNYEDRGVIKGESTQTVLKALHRAGIQYDINIYPWSRAIKMALNKPNVMIYTIVRMPAREALFIWSRPVLDAEFASLFRLKSRTDVKVTSLNDVEKYKVGLIKDSMNEYYFRAHNLSHILFPASTNLTQNLVDLLEGKVDLVATSDKHFNFAVRKLGMDVNLFEKAYPLFKIYPYMAFSHGTSPELINKVNQAYDDLVQEGAIPLFK